MDRGTWRALVHGVAKRWTGLSEQALSTSGAGGSCLTPSQHRLHPDQVLTVYSLFPRLFIPHSRLPHPTQPNCLIAWVYKTWHDNWRHFNFPKWLFTSFLNLLSHSTLWLQTQACGSAFVNRVSSNCCSMSHTRHHVPVWFVHPTVDGQIDWDFLYCPASCPGHSHQAPITGLHVTGSGYKHLGRNAESIRYVSWFNQVQSAKMPPESWHRATLPHLQRVLCHLLRTPAWHHPAF